MIDLCTAIKSLLTLIEENVQDNAITWTRRRYRDDKEIYKNPEE